MKKQIYLDYASSTPVRREVLQAMLPYFNKKYANPSSLHAAGREVEDAVEEARKKVAGILNCKSEEIIFTSGGTESINLAIKGIALRTNGRRKGHIITTKIEHPAAVETCKYLEKQGFQVSYLDVDKNGLVNPKDVEKAIKKSTVLISIIYANNEIGTIQPIRRIASVAGKHKLPLHVDACQTGLLELNVKKLNVDLMTLNGSKIYGPKGIGVLYRKSNLQLEPLIHGGNQESTLRSGTEHVPGIVGFAKALALIQKDKNIIIKQQSSMRDYFIQRIQKNIPDTKLNGHPTSRLSNNINISFTGVEAESLLRYLSQEGIYASSGSACSSNKKDYRTSKKANKIEISRVLKAIGLSKEDALGSIRFTIGNGTTKRSMDHVVSVLKKIVISLRKI